MKNNYTKVTIKKDIAEQGKIQAAAQDRSLANYVEYLIQSDIAPIPLEDRAGMSGSSVTAEEGSE